MGIKEDRIKFEKIFSNLPQKIRNEDIIIVLDDQPYTWSIAYMEIIKIKSKIGDRILKKLKDLEII